MMGSNTIPHLQNVHACDTEMRNAGKGSFQEKKTHTTFSTKQAQSLYTQIFVEFHITLSLIYHQRVIVIQVKNILVTVWIKASAE